MEQEKELKEEWRDYKGWCGHVKVSNKGRVMTLPFCNSKGWTMRKLQLDGKGYLHVQLCGCGEKKLVKVHRMVAETFIPNPKNLPQINHKDEDKTNNSVENLEWCDNNYNNHYKTKCLRAGLSISRQYKQRKKFQTMFPYAVRPTPQGQIDWDKVLDVEFQGDEKQLRKFLKEHNYSVNGITRVFNSIHQKFQQPN